MCWVFTNKRERVLVSGSFVGQNSSLMPESERNDQTEQITKHTTQINTRSIRAGGLRITQPRKHLSRRGLIAE